jgi:hypothetical protein
MATTFTLISSVTVGSGGATSIDFTSIPSTYTDLLILASLRSTGTNGAGSLYFNNDTTNANYSIKRLGYSQPNPFSDGYSASYCFYSTKSTFTASTFSNNFLYIPNYRSSNYKSFSADDVAENNSTTADLYLTAGLWSNTSAITSIKIQQAVDVGFVQYSTAYLYGISNA